MSQRAILAFIAVLGLSAALGVYSVSAHVLKTDGTTGATLHIEPNDNPGTNATSTISLFFQSKPQFFLIFEIVFSIPKNKFRS